MSNVGFTDPTISVSNILGLKNNFADEISSGEFYVFVIAYNDQITGRKREVAKNEKGEKICKLFDSEKAGLEVAFKASKDGNISDQDVNKLFSSFCCDEVSAILSTKESYAKKMQKLHNLAVDRATKKEGMGSFKYYSKTFDLVEKCSKPSRQESFKKDCNKLEDSLNSGDIGKTKNKAQEMKEAVDTLEHMFCYILPSVKSVVSFEACLKCMQNKNNAETETEFAQNA